MEQLHPHADRIDRLGGPTEVAKLIGIYESRGAVQRVSNWKRRGIPYEVLLSHPELRDEPPRQSTALRAEV